MINLPFLYALAAWLIVKASAKQRQSFSRRKKRRHSSGLAYIGLLLDDLYSRVCIIYVCASHYKVNLK